MPKTDVSGITHSYNSGERGWGSSANKNFELLSRVQQQDIVLSIVSTPPTSPSNGDTYIIGASPTGAWSSATANHLAYYDATWQYYTPRAGLLKYVASNQALYCYTGAAWVAIAAAPWSGTQAQYDALSTAAKALPRLHLITG